MLFPGIEVVDKPVESLKAAVHASHVAAFVHGDLRHGDLRHGVGGGRLVTESHDLWWLSTPVYLVWYTTHVLY